MRHVPMEVAQRFDHELGNPEDVGVLLSYVRCDEVAETEQFPHEMCRQLDALGLQYHYVPTRLGGNLISYETTAQLVRMVARRDLGIAVAHAKTFLGAVCVWIAGNEAQATALGRMIASGVPLSWGLTERDHGSDLLSGELVAQAVAGATSPAYRLDGEKWPINNATRCGAICLLARTDQQGGARGFSLFLVDKARLDPTRYQCLPKVPTHGNRGADISGIVLHEAVVDAGALVGPEGSGLETVLKGLQVTRTLCAALSLGSADHAFRIVVELMSHGGQQGRRIMDSASTRKVVAVAYADHLLAEALSTMAFRAIHTLTPEMSVLAAATKYLVPTRTEAAIARLRRLAGPAAQLHMGDQLGSLGKIERDHRVVSLFDGNTVVNLHTLVNIFPLLSRAHRYPETGTFKALRACATLSRSLPEAGLDQLSLVPRHGVSILASAATVSAELSAVARRDRALEPAAHAARRICAALSELLTEIGAQRPTRMDVPPHAFSLAKRLALCLAGLCAVHVWLRNHDTAKDQPEDALWRDGVWLRAVLGRVLTELGDRSGTPSSAYSVLFEVLVSQVSSGRLPSLFGCRLAEGAT